MNDIKLTPVQELQIEQILQDAHSHGLTKAQVQNQIDRVVTSSSQHIRS